MCHFALAWIFHHRRVLVVILLVRIPDGQVSVCLFGRRSLSLETHLYQVFVGAWKGLRVVKDTLSRRGLVRFKPILFISLHHVATWSQRLGSISLLAIDSIAILELAIESVGPLAFLTRFVAWKHFLLGWQLRLLLLKSWLILLLWVFLLALVNQDVQLPLNHVREFLPVGLMDPLRSMLGLSTHLSYTAFEVGDLVDFIDVLVEVLLIAPGILQALRCECYTPRR